MACSPPRLLGKLLSFPDSVSLSLWWLEHPFLMGSLWRLKAIMCAECQETAEAQWSLLCGRTDRSHCRQGNREDSQSVWFPSGSNQVARPKDGLESFPWQIWKRFVLPSSRPHAASDRRAGITGGHSWQPIHFADSSIRGAAPSQSLASRLKAESCKAAGTWRYAGKLLPCEGQPWFVICFPF